MQISTSVRSESQANPSQSCLCINCTVLMRACAAETHGVGPDVLCKICPFSLTENSAPQQLGARPLVWWDDYEFNGTTAEDVACARGCLVPPPAAEAEAEALSVHK